MESNNQINNTENELQVSLENIVENTKNEVENTKNEVENILNNVENEMEETINKIENVVENKVDETLNKIENKIENVVENGKKEFNNRILNNPLIGNLASTASMFSKLVNPLNNPLNSITSKLNQNSKLNEINELLKPVEMVEKSSSRSSSKSNSRRESKIDIKDENKDENLPVLTTRNRKQDRRNLANDINSELPISIRFNDSINIDNNEVVENYISDWTQFENEDTNKLDILIEEIFVNEEKYKGLSNFNYNCARSIQFTLILMGMLGIFLQAKGASPETVNNFTIASSGITTLTTSLLTFFSFSKKSPHYSKISFMLRRLRNWIEKLIVVPVNKRVSPYDLYVISKIAFESILTEAREGLTDNK